MPNKLNNVIQFRKRTSDVILDSLSEQEDLAMPDFFFEFLNHYEQVGLEFCPMDDEVA